MPEPKLKLNPAEFKPVGCERCGHVMRRVVAWLEHMENRFRSDLVLEASKVAYFCIGCAAQVDQHGKLVNEISAEYLNPEDLKKMMEDFR